MSDIDAWKILDKWEDKNKSKCFLVVDEEDAKEMFNPKEIEGIDIYKCIQEVWEDIDLSDEYQHIMDLIQERIATKIEENVGE
jgi:hypothetical protein